MKTIDLDQAESHFASLQGKAKEAALRGLVSAGVRTLQEIVLRIIPSRSPKPVDRAAAGYLGGWKTYPVPDGAIVENLETHAAFIEWGVKASDVRIGRRMILALSQWGVRKGYVTAEESLSFAWALAKRMQQRGIFNGGIGFRILEEAINKHIPKFIEEEIAKELEKL
jgi:hypothetical protein